MNDTQTTTTTSTPPLPLDINTHNHNNDDDSNHEHHHQNQPQPQLQLQPHFLDDKAKAEIIEQMRDKRNKMKLPSTVKVHQITTIEEAEKYCQIMHEECIAKADHVGIDAEWKPNKKGEPRHPVALLQIATRSHVLLLHMFDIASNYHLHHSSSSTLTSSSSNTHPLRNEVEGEEDGHEDGGEGGGERGRSEIATHELPLKALEKLLGDGDVIKVGVGVKGDAKKILKDYGFSIKGVVELGPLVGQPGFGLKSLCEYIFGLNLPKDPFLQCSDWSLPWTEYSRGQIEYAALDGFAAYMIFSFLSSSSPFNHHHRHNKTVMMAITNNNNNHSDGGGGGENDRPKFKNNKRKGDDDNDDDNEGGGGSDDNDDEMKAKMRKEKRKKTAHRSKPLYEGCKMLDPGGTLLMYCSLEKLNWYVSKGLGVLIPGDLISNPQNNNNRGGGGEGGEGEGEGEEELPRHPPSVRLNFNPAGKKDYMQEKKWTLRGENEVLWVNRCVRCGLDKNLSKFHVIPRCYRQHFPVNGKFHCSHDVVLLCRDCHVLCSWNQDLYMKRIAEEKSISIYGIGSKRISDTRAAKVKSCAFNLLHPPSSSSSSSPPILASSSSSASLTEEELTAIEVKKRLQEERWRNMQQKLHDIVADYLNVDLSQRNPPHLTTNELQSVADMKVVKKNSEFISHGAAVVATLDTPDKLQEFIVGFRKEFVSHKLKFLPISWDIQHDWEEHHGSGVRATSYF